MKYVSNDQLYRVCLEIGFKRATLAEHYNCSVWVIDKRKQALKKAGYCMPKDCTDKLTARRKLPCDELLISEYERSNSLTAIAKKYGVSYGTAKEYIDQAVINANLLADMPDITDEQILDDFAKLDTWQKVAAKYNVDQYTILTRLADALQTEENIHVRFESVKYFMSLPNDTVYFEFKRARTYRRLARKYNVSVITIKKKLEPILNDRGEINELSCYANLPSDEQIVKEYIDNGLAFVARKYNVTKSTIDGLLPDDVRPTSKSKKLPISDDVLLLDLEELGTRAAVAAKYNSTMVDHRFRKIRASGKHNILLSQSKENFSLPDRKKFTQDYKQCKDVAELAQMYKVSRHTVEKAVSNYNLDNE